MTLTHCPACGQSVEIVAAFDPPGYLANHIETIGYVDPYWIETRNRAAFVMTTRMCPGSGKAVDQQT